MSATQTTMNHRATEIGQEAARLVRIVRCGLREQTADQVAVMEAETKIDLSDGDPSVCGAPLLEQAEFEWREIADAARVAGSPTLSEDCEALAELCEELGALLDECGDEVDAVAMVAMTVSQAR